MRASVLVCCLPLLLRPVSCFGFVLAHECSAVLRAVVSPSRGRAVKGRNVRGAGLYPEDRPWTLLRSWGVSADTSDARGGVREAPIACRSAGPGEPSRRARRCVQDVFKPLPTRSRPVATRARSSNPRRRVRGHHQTTPAAERVSYTGSVRGRLCGHGEVSADTSDAHGGAREATADCPWTRPGEARRRPQGDRCVVSASSNQRLPSCARPESVREACPRTKSTHLIYRSLSLLLPLIDPHPSPPPLPASAPYHLPVHHPHRPPVLSVHHHLLLVSHLPVHAHLLSHPPTYLPDPCSPLHPQPPQLLLPQPAPPHPFPRPAPLDHTHSRCSAPVSGPESRPCRHTPRRPRPGARVREVGWTPPPRVAMGGGSDTSRGASPGCASRRGRARRTRSGRCAPSRHTPRRLDPGRMCARLAGLVLTPNPGPAGMRVFGHSHRGGRCPCPGAATRRSRSAWR